MPCVFMGSFIGILLGKLLGEDIQIIIFGVTVAWSIYTTMKKACELRAKENKDAETVGEGIKDSLLQNTEQEEDESEP